MARQLAICVVSDPEPLVNIRPRTLMPLAASALMLLLALLFPTEWYDRLPRQPGLEIMPLNGVLLLRVLLAAVAVVTAAVTLSGWRWTTLPPQARICTFATRQVPDDLTRTDARRWLLGISLLALVLRVYRIDAELWIDELYSLSDYALQPWSVIVASYRTSNNHLLMSLLMKASVALFGVSEWTVRLAAVSFGVATIPAMYRLARLAMSRRASLGAALLLAVSYHHVFFSQNARGYIAYLFFALVSTRALLDALRDDRRRDWMVYGTATLLGVMALLNTVFVIAAQLCVAIVALAIVHRGSGTSAPLLRRLAAVYAMTGVACALVFAIPLPEAYLVITRTYAEAGTGFAPTSMELLRDVARGVSDGFGTRGVIAAVPFLLLASVGWLVLWRRQWAIAMALTLPGVLTAAVLVARGMTVSPRFFLLWLPLAVLTAAVSIEAAAERLPAPIRRRAGITIFAVVAAVSLLSLRWYYTVPKQPFIAAIAYVEQRRHPDDLVLAVTPTTRGVRFYGDRLQAPIASHYRFISSVAELDSAVAARGSERTFVLTTLEYGLSLQHPELLARIRAGWERDTSFPGTIGDGQISVWSGPSSAATLSP
jgi:mannosyltransferase